MTKKGPGTRDHRQEPDPAGTGENFRVDRVFVGPAPAARAPTPVSAPRARRASGSGQPAVNDVPADAELALRRQLSRLQRQLAEAQRELANKDDELATAVEKRLEVASSNEQVLAQLRESEQKLHELADDRARTAGVEQRLQESIAAADELTHQLERERAERGAMAVQVDESAAAFERARVQWKDESTAAEQQHIAELARLEIHKRAAIEAAEKALEDKLERQREAHQAELEEIRAAQERSLAALRGELEPQVAQARTRAEQIAGLESEIAAIRSEHVRELAERNELTKWETQQQAEAHAAELEAQARAHATELSRATEELEAKSQALVQSERNGELRESLWEQTTGALRDSQKKLQQELAEARERSAQSDASKWAVEQRLVTTLQSLEKISEAKRELETRLDEVEAEARRSAMDRQRFAAYLEEGLAMLGALPAAEPEVIEELDVDPEPDDVAS